MLLSNQILELEIIPSGGGENGCGSGLLGVTFNKKVNISPDGTAFVLQDHAAPSGELTIIW